MISLLVLHTLTSRAAKPEDEVNAMSYSTVTGNYRTLADIIWSCLTTILLCTWVSLHPNVPKPVDEKRLTQRQRYAHRLYAFVKDDVFLFVVLLLGPELILMWALRQRLVVEYMVRTRKVPTRRHGFFIIMGGFHKFSRADISKSAPFDPALSDRLVGSGVEQVSTDERGEEEHGEPDHPLDRYDVCRLLDDGRLQLPLEVEIDDKSKSDWIAKSLVLFQTLWFVVQCIARKMDHLPLTELEVVTLGYALLNLVIYVIWWDKPQKVARPIRVFCGELPERNEEQRILKWRMEVSGWFVRMLALIEGNPDEYVELRSVTQTPMYHSGNPPQDCWRPGTLSVEGTATTVTAVIGGVLGVIHLLAWSSPFPTRRMLVLWRCGSILMAVAPFPTLTLYTTSLLLDFLLGVDNSFVRVIVDWIIRPLFYMSGVLSLWLVPLVYISGRVITLVLAFQTLASLPPEAFQSVQWTNLFPHI
ncbi:hypothetical protein FRC19_003268 [Serendipita sp. 401]|nr:hypothetical protein FRC19_003268 [Serendipita sp. 401]